MNDSNDEFSKSGNKFIIVEKLPSCRDKMSKTLSWDTIKGVAKVLFKENFTYPQLLVFN